MPIFDEAANKIKEEFPESGKVVMGKVDCDKEGSVATRFHITKYPTLKIIRNGQPAKREYRGQRSADAFATFVKEQLEDPIKEFTTLSELLNLESNKRIIIGKKQFTKSLFSGKYYKTFQVTLIEEINHNMICLEELL